MENFLGLLFEGFCPAAFPWNLAHLTLPDSPTVDQHFHREGGMVGLVVVQNKSVAPQVLNPAVKHNSSLAPNTRTESKKTTSVISAPITQLSHISQTFGESTSQLSTLPP